MTGQSSQASLPEDSGEPQPQISENTSRLRRLRTRPTTQGPLSSSQNELASRSRARSSVKSESAGPHRNASASRAPAMSHPHLTADPPRLTKTGRISKARKGVKDAHVCPRCNKKYSRAEHLRRHASNHEPEKLQCGWPKCGRSFSRRDLLVRHEEKHAETGESRRLSSASCSSSGQTGGSGLKQSRPPSRTAGTPGPRATEDAPSVQSFQPRPASRGKAVAPETRYSQGFRHDSLHIEPPLFSPASPFNQGELAIPSKIVPSNPTSGPHTFGQDVQTEGHTTAVSQSSSDLDIIFESNLPVPESSPWNPFTTPDFPSFVSFSDLTIDQNWPGFPSTSISPLSGTPHIPWVFEPTDQGSFPLSVASSPRSQNATLSSIRMLPTVTGSVPYPLPWGGHRDQYGGLELEGLLEEQQLGVYLSLKTKQHYVEAYWKYFHPLFPILHRQTYQRHKSNPLFSAAVMAVGAQYCDRGFAKSDSRILHEKCQELISKYKEGFKTTAKLEYMQAIFLVELLSHFKAKRASTALSTVFVAMYNQLWQRHRNDHPLSIGRSALDRLLNVHDAIAEQDLRAQWRSWIEAHSVERLLVASYILESQIATLLIRPDPPPRPADSGSELYMPMPIGLWDASSHLIWAQRLRSFSHIPPTTDVYQALDDILGAGQHRTLQYDDFTSSLLIACQANSIFAQSRVDISPYLTQVHPLFTPQHYPTLKRVLSSNPSVQLQHDMVLLSLSTPFKALLAVSGESWVLSQKLSSVSREAKEKFEGLKAELRLWTDDLQPRYHGLYPGAHSHPPLATAAHPNPSESRAARALQRALRIISLALDTAPSVPIFGPEMGVYYAALVLWTITHASVSRTLQPEPSATNSPPTMPNFEPGAAEAAIRTFVAQADDDISASIVVGEGIPSLAAVERWRDATTAVLRWSAWILNGAPPVGDQSASGGGVGELMGMARDVLEALARRGWQGHWF